LTNAVTASATGAELLSSELVYSPVEEGDAPGDELEGKISDLVEALEENEDCLRVWTTLD
jgi:translational activator of cytochrome c oxidase 1